MTPEQATGRYFKIFVPSMIGYLVGSVGTTWAADNMNLPPAALYGLALVPIVAILSAFWAHWRFINEVDEFLRSIQIKAIIFGIACVMVIASGWGTLELLADAPKLKVFWLLPIFWVSYSAAAIVVTKREGGMF
ncbi:MAG: hypothetical protein ABJN26_15315 [Stappiaceae bacterium]